jgi:hypothetical protein
MNYETQFIQVPNVVPSETLPERPGEPDCPVSRICNYLFPSDAFLIIS